MHEADYAELLNHIRTSMNERGLAELDREIVDAVAEGEGKRTSESTLAYVEHLRTVIRLRSGVAATEVLNWLNDLSDGIEHPQRVSRLSVALAGADADLYARTEVDLTIPRIEFSSMPELSELDTLIQELQSDVAARDLDGEDREFDT